MLLTWFYLYIFGTPPQNRNFLMYITFTAFQTFPTIFFSYCAFPLIYFPGTPAAPACCTQFEFTCPWNIGGNRQGLPQLPNFRLSLGLHLQFITCQVGELHATWVGGAPATVKLVRQCRFGRIPLGTWRKFPLAPMHFTAACTLGATTHTQLDGTPAIQATPGWEHVVGLSSNLTGEQVIVLLLLYTVEEMKEECLPSLPSSLIYIILPITLMVFYLIFYHSNFPSLNSFETLSVFYFIIFREALPFILPLSHSGRKLVIHSEGRQGKWKHAFLPPTMEGAFDYLLMMTLTVMTVGYSNLISTRNHAGKGAAFISRSVDITLPLFFYTNPRWGRLCTFFHILPLPSSI